VLAASLNGIRASYESHGEGDRVLLVDGLSALGDWLFPIIIERWTT
jgi:hypothetical protein